MDRPALDGPPGNRNPSGDDIARNDFYREHARRAASILEYGAGGSTVIAAECNVPSLYSVDSDARWIARLDGGIGRDHAPEYHGADKMRDGTTLRGLTGGDCF